MLYKQHEHNPHPNKSRFAAAPVETLWGNAENRWRTWMQAFQIVRLIQKLPLVCIQAGVFVSNARSGRPASMCAIDFQHCPIMFQRAPRQIGICLGVGYAHVVCIAC